MDPQAPEIPDCQSIVSLWDSAGCAHTKGQEKVHYALHCSVRN